jgi:hypothetical protein
MTGQRAGTKRDNKRGVALCHERGEEENRDGGVSLALSVVFFLVALVLLGWHTRSLELRDTFSSVLLYSTFSLLASFHFSAVLF